MSLPTGLNSRQGRWAWVGEQFRAWLRCPGLYGFIAGLASVLREVGYGLPRSVTITFNLSFRPYHVDLDVVSDNAPSTIFYQFDLVLDVFLCYVVACEEHVILTPG